MIAIHNAKDAEVNQKLFFFSPLQFTVVTGILLIVVYQKNSKLCFCCLKALDTIGYNWTKLLAENCIGNEQWRAVDSMYYYYYFYKLLLSYFIVL